jgi:hypothetical protein
MITFFTTAKPFRGHDGIIQRNALKSWKLLNPDVEVILFGDDEGAARVCAEFGLRHEPHVDRHESGVKCLNYMFARAQEITLHNYLCFSNCDIVLMQDFWNAFEIARSWKKRFLLVGQRWDTDVADPIDFNRPDWGGDLRQFALSKGFQQDAHWIDFFLFSKGLYTDMPPLLVGHCYWDNWMIWKALSNRVSVLDASHFLVPVHQNHGYNTAFGRIKGVPTDTLSMVNLELIGGPRHIRIIKSCTHTITSDGRIGLHLSRYTNEYTPFHRKLWQPFLYKVWLPAWHFFLRVTRPVRSALGLRSAAMRRSRGKV